MEVFEAVRTVLAVRQFQEKPIPEALVRQIVEAGHLSASSMNGQPWHFLTIENKETLRHLGTLAQSGQYIAQAPLAIIVGMEHSPFALSDASRAIQSMILTAWEQGIGSNWVGFENLQPVNALVGIPEQITILAILPFGYPIQAIGKGQKKRKPLGEIAHRERWEQPFEESTRRNQMKRQLSKGICAFCHEEYRKSGIGRHLQTCKQRARSEGQTRTFHLQVEGRYLSMYWMHLTVTAETTLATLDQFLRDTWLECCGHLSAFEMGGLRYTVDAGFSEDAYWNRRKKTMHVRLDEVLHPGQTCTYEYDFGSTTELNVKVISQQETTAQEKPIQVLARNSPDPVACNECGKLATGRCAQCARDGRGYLCDACAREHSCGEERLMPLVNSPRAGVCGYTGPSHASRW